MSIVRTKEELERAVNNNEEKIIIKGYLASKIIKRHKTKSIVKKAGIGGIVAGVVAGVVAAPFTGGASAVAGASYIVSSCAVTGLSSFALTATAGGTAIAVSTAEVIAGIVGVLGALGIAAGVVNTIAKNYDIKISVKSTTVECTRK